MILIQSFDVGWLRLTTMPPPRKGWLFVWYFLLNSYKIPTLFRKILLTILLSCDKLNAYFLKESKFTAKKGENYEQVD